MAPSSSSASDSDRDESLDEDLEALRRALVISGAAGSSSSAAGGDDSSDSDSSGTDDLNLLRSLQVRFSGGGTVANTLSVVQPHPPADSDDEDDLATLRAIQRRFEQYDADGIKKIDENDNQETGIANRAYQDFGSSESEEPRDVAARPVAYSQFPKTAQRFVDALKLNRSCQKFIRRKLMEIEAKIEENKDLKERIKCLIDFQAACKRKVGGILCQKEDPRVRLVSTRTMTNLNSEKKQPRKIRALCYGPTENSHVPKYKMVMKRFPVSLHKLPWSNIEKEGLLKGLKQQYQEMLVLNSMSLESDFDLPMDSNPMLALSSSDLEVTPDKIRSFLPLVNWDRLASMYLPGRFGDECEARWLNCEDPMINHSPWTKSEEKKLLFILQERGVYNWIDIAITLGTCRTPFQCLARYQRSLNPHILKKDWTSEEDAELCAAVEAFGDNNWQLVASHLEGRTGSQCSNRWRKALPPDRRVGRWSVDEDRRLKVAVMLFGAKSWNKIAQFAPGRTQVQCRERWLNCLDPSLNLEAWTKEEDAQLLAAIKKHGHSWSKVAALVPPRTDSQCRRRWKVLLPHEEPLLRKARQVKKSVLISNFVDRESERPSIGPDDFSPLLNLPATEPKNNRSTNRKESSDKLPKKPSAKARNSKPRVKARKSSVRDSTVGGMKNSCNVNCVDLSLVPYEDASLVESERIKRGDAATECVNGRGSLNPLSENMRSDLPLVPGEHPDTFETGSYRTKRNRMSSAKRNTKSTVESRGYSGQNSIEISPIDVALMPSNPAGIRSIKKRNGKASSDDQPKKSRAKCKEAFAENMMADGLVNSVRGITCCNSSIGSGENANSDIVGRVRRKRKQCSDDPQIKSSKKFCARNGRSFEDNVVNGVTMDPAANCIPSEVLNVKEVNFLAVEAISDEKIKSDQLSNITGPIGHKKHRAKTRKSPRGSLLADDMVTCNVPLPEGRKRLCRPDSKRVICDPSSSAIGEAVPLQECTLINVMDSNSQLADRRPNTLDVSQSMHVDDSL